MTTEQQLRNENFTLKLNLIETSLQFVALQRQVVTAEYKAFKATLPKDEPEAESLPASNA